MRIWPDIKRDNNCEKYFIQDGDGIYIYCGREKHLTFCCDTEIWELIAKKYI